MSSAFLASLQDEENEKLEKIQDQSRILNKFDGIDNTFDDIYAEIGIINNTLFPAGKFGIDIITILIRQIKELEYELEEIKNMVGRIN